MNSKKTIGPMFVEPDKKLEKKTVSNKKFKIISCQNKLICQKLIGS